MAKEKEERGKKKSRRKNKPLEKIRELGYVRSSS